jgi:chromosome segregation ATPase
MHEQLDQVNAHLEMVQAGLTAAILRAVAAEEAAASSEEGKAQAQREEQALQARLAEIGAALHALEEAKSRGEQEMMQTRKQLEKEIQDITLREQGQQDELHAVQQKLHEFEARLSAAHRQADEAQTKCAEACELACKKQAELVSMSDNFTCEAHRLTQLVNSMEAEIKDLSRQALDTHKRLQEERAQCSGLTLSVLSFHELCQFPQICNVYHVCLCV